MAQRARARRLDFVGASYGVVWQEAEQPPATGSLELLPRALRLEGLAESGPKERELAYDSLDAVRIGRRAGERIAGRPTLILEPRSGDSIRVAAVADSNSVTEIAEHVAALRLGPEAARSIALVVPIKDGSHDAVRALLEAGPPFDPAESALDRHQVFLTPNEVVFLFESRLGTAALESLLASPAVLELASSWSEHVAAPPRVAEDVYAWSRGRE